MSAKRLPKKKPKQRCFLPRKALSYPCKASSLDVQSEESNSTEKERTQREVIERERRLIPYMTFYLAQSIRNPNSGESQNVLIPVRAHQPNLERIHGVPQIQSNNIQSAAPQRYKVPVTQPVTIPFPDNGFYPTPSIELTPTSQYEGQEAVQYIGQVYRFKSPGPQVEPHQQQHLIRTSLPKTQTRPRVNQKYSEPQFIKFIPYTPKYNPAQYVVTTPRPQYTSTKLHPLSNNQYLQSSQNYYKESPRAIAETPYVPKVYAVDIIPQSAPKIEIQRFRQRPEKSNINQIFISSTIPTPYRSKVKFEVEDARVRNIVNNVQAEKIQDPTPITYVPEQISSNYISDQEQVTEPPRDEEQNVYYTHEISQERPNHVAFVPVHRTQVLTINPEAVQIESAGSIKNIPDSQIDQVQQVKELNTVRSQVHETNDIGHTSQGISHGEQNNPSVDSNVVNLLTILKQTNQLPQNFTPENIDNSIRTLALILQRLQNERKHHIYSSTKVKSKPKPTAVIISEEKQNKFHSYPSPSGTSTPGRPGVDYPTYSTIPRTQFDCSTQRYKGFFGDPDTNCQVWHYCDLNGGQASFLCPNGTIFSQVALTCDWWFNVKCASTSQLYVLNERLYKYILPFSPSFPEDYSGPLVDRYLAAKFKEMEAKSRLKALKALISTSKPETSVSTKPAEVAETTPVYNAEKE